MAEKRLVTVVFGGQSSEHEVSCMSAANVIEQIDTEDYDITLIGIREDGSWTAVECVEDIRSGAWKNGERSVVFSPDAIVKGYYILKEGQIEEVVHPDVMFPVLHGLYGEDGTIQGVFEMAHIPYVGCGVFASAASMDKFFTKILVDNIGVRQAKYVGVYRHELKEPDVVIERIEKELPYPVFVKPSRAGSSKGVSKAADREGLKKALAEAAKHDSKILVEETVVGRELECAVLGNEEVNASGVGEILATAEFYDFDAKYYDETSKTETHPDLPREIYEEIRKDACAIFRAVGGRGLSRVDFFLDDKGVVFNEINTLPGFTAISMYPMLWAEQGISKKELIARLLELAMEEEA